MGVRLKIGELIQTLGHTYRTIDVRCAATLEEGSWVSALAVIRLTYEEQSSAAARLHRLEERYVRVDTNHLRILHDALPFTSWEQLRHDAASGVLHVQGAEVHLRQPISIEDLGYEPRAGHYDLRPFDGIQWPGVYVTTNLTADSVRLGHDSILREVGPLGYSNPHEAINELCELNVTHSQNPGQEFYVAVPLFACLLDAKLLPFEKRLIVTIRRHNQIQGLSAGVTFRELNFQMGESSRVRKNLNEFEIIEESSPLRTEVVSADVGEVQEDSWVEVKLVHSSLGEIQQRMLEARSLIPAVERNILHEALKRFCPETDLHDGLVRPHAIKPRKVTPSAAFELLVGWLLGLHGLCTVVLGEYEHLLAPETRIPRGSVDILAWKPQTNLLLLVACTLNPPKEEDFGNLINMRSILAREVFAGVKVNIVPVIFTAASDSPSYRESGDWFGFIPIVNTDGIEKLLGYLRTGQEKRFFEFLGNPQLSELR